MEVFVWVVNFIQDRGLMECCVVFTNIVTTSVFCIYQGRKIAYLEFPLLFAECGVSIQVFVITTHECRQVKNCSNFKICPN